MFAHRLVSVVSRAGKECSDDWRKQDVRWSRKPAATGKQWLGLQSHIAKFTDFHRDIFRTCISK